MQPLHDHPGQGADLLSCAVDDRRVACLPALVHYAAHICLNNIDLDGKDLTAICADLESQSYHPSSYRGHVAYGILQRVVNVDLGVFYAEEIVFTIKSKAWQLGSGTASRDLLTAEILSAKLVSRNHAARRLLQQRYHASFTLKISYPPVATRTHPEL